MVLRIVPLPPPSRDSCYTGHTADNLPQDLSAHIGSRVAVGVIAERQIRWFLVDQKGFRDLRQDCSSKSSDEEKRTRGDLLDLFLLLIVRLTSCMPVSPVCMVKECGEVEAISWFSWRKSPDSGISEFRVKANWLKSQSANLGRSSLLERNNIVQNKDWVKRESCWCWDSRRGGNAVESYGYTAWMHPLGNKTHHKFVILGESHVLTDFEMLLLSDWYCNG
jgi:hypothetical protein